jgi:hypothetical protein
LTWKNERLHVSTAQVAVICNGIPVDFAVRR